MHEKGWHYPKFSDTAFALAFVMPFWISKFLFCIGKLYGICPDLVALLFLVWCALCFYSLQKSLIYFLIWGATFLVCKISLFAFTILLLASGFS